MHVFKSTESAVVYQINICPSDLWMDVGDFIGDYADMDRLSRELTPGMYCLMTDHEGTIVVFNTGIKLYQVDLEEDRDFLEFYEALDEQIRPEHIEELYQLSIL